MPEYMKAVAITGERKTEVVDIVKPVYGDEEILMRVHSCALCTWEQRVFTRAMPFPLPYIGGHEVAGTIEAIGAKVNASDYPVGAKIAVRLTPNCGECANCRRGAENMCMESFRYSTGGADFKAFSEYMVVKPRQTYVVGDDVPIERLVFAEPLGCVITGMDKLNIQLGEDVVVVGGGVMGLLNALTAKLRGARVILSEPDEARRKKALELGVDFAVDPLHTDINEYVKEMTNGEGARAVICTVTARPVIMQSMSLLAIQGRFLMFGKMFPDGTVDLKINWVHDTETVITGTMSASVNGFYKAVNLLKKGILKPDQLGLLSAVLPYRQAQEAYEQAIRTDTYRVAISFKE